MPYSDRIVVGVDVGGMSKGYHAVALRNRSVVGKLHTVEAAVVRDWCLSLEALAVGVDAPCHESLTGRGRSAERAMAKEWIYSFSTPTRDVATTKAFYGWMLCGWELFDHLKSNFPLFTGGSLVGPTSFETFPHAVACALARRVVSAKHKRSNRRPLLLDAGVDETALANIDEVDAALCALAAVHLSGGHFKTYGNGSDGLIVVPSYDSFQGLAC